MVDLMSLLSDALIGSFQMFMLNDFGKNMFPYRIKTCWKRILIYGVTALVILSVNHIESTFINIMMIPVSYTIASIVIFQGSVWKKIILACCYYMLAIVPEFLFAVITGAYGVTGTENNFHSELEKLLSLLLMSTITFLLVKCVNQITRKKNYQTIENKLFTVLLTLPAATIIIFMCIYYSQISYTGVNRIMIPIGAALLLMTNICIFAVFDKLIEKSEEVKKMELLYQKSKAENINQKYINKVNEDKRVFLHDVNKFLCTAASLIENGKNLELDSMVRHLGIRMEELKEYLKELEEYVRNSLVQYMLPQEFITFAWFPLSQNGKVDRKKIRQIVGNRKCTMVKNTDYVGVEREIAELWKEMLSVEDIGRNDNFFEIGGDSLLATQFVECLKQKYEIEMSLREIFNNAELDRVSKIIEEKIECNKQMIEGEI